VQAAHLLGRAVEAVGAHEEDQAKTEPEQMRGEEGGRGVEGGKGSPGAECGREGTEARGDGAGEEDSEEVEGDGEDAGGRVRAEEMREARGGACRIVEEDGTDGLGSGHDFPLRCVSRLARLCPRRNQRNGEVRPVAEPANPGADPCVAQ